MKTKVYDYNELLKNELKNEDFKKEYEQTSDEFTLTKEIIRLRKIKKMTQK